MKAKLIAAPSPSGGNAERLFLFKMPRQPLGALDALKRHDADVPDLGRLRVELDEILARSLSEAELEECRALLDQHLGAVGEYDCAHEGQDEEEEKSEGMSRKRDRDGMASNAMARDRRRQMAADAAADRAAESFDRMFPEAARIRIGGC